jgi:N-acetylglucosamine-6-phosphate deacetylase
MRIKGNLCGGELVEVKVQEGCIASVHVLGPADPAEPYLSPGFIDIQINGFAGVDFSSPHLTPEEAISVLPSLWSTGVTSFCPTLITNTRERLLANFRVLEQARRLDVRFACAVPCYHLEGPYLSPGPSHGAHDPALTRAPDWNEFTALQAAAGGRIGIVTLAPELPGALDFIRRAHDAGITVAIGHTDGSLDDVHRAVEAGASLATHLGNGCPMLIHRHRAPFWAQLSDYHLTASIICDGFHLPPEVVQVLVRTKGLSRTILVTDAVHVAGLPPGPYSLVGVPIELESTGRVVRVGSDSMAGSSLSMNRAITVFQNFAAVSLADAVSAATLNPARLLEHPDVCSGLLPGQPANVVLFRPGPLSLEIESLWLHGQGSCTPIDDG